MIYHVKEKRSILLLHHIMFQTQEIESIKAKKKLRLLETILKQAIMGHKNVANLIDHLLNVNRTSTYSKYCLEIEKLSPVKKKKQLYSFHQNAFKGTLFTRYKIKILKPCHQMYDKKNQTYTEKPKRARYLTTLRRIGSNDEHSFCKLSTLRASTITLHNLKSYKKNCILQETNKCSTNIITLQQILQTIREL